MEEHFSCLDLLRVRWTAESGLQESEYGTLLEIWRSGGTLHTDRLIPQGARVSLSTGGGQIEAESGCHESDEFGYYVEIKAMRPWFPVPYLPSDIMKTRGASTLQ